MHLSPQDRRHGGGRGGGDDVIPANAFSSLFTMSSQQQTGDWPTARPLPGTGGMRHPSNTRSQPYT
ncbi:hypothetical protein E2C01_089288 [Portunus trituberculatus]|uniref:Uncharacterized protein n=1 Tax=Portunus trituberculatus TaxID=210409 RepID=A0A5B7JIP5_PORTR|nr:hypothetical protein [Portunus trituberculatus]